MATQSTIIQRLAEHYRATDRYKRKLDSARSHVDDAALTLAEALGNHRSVETKTRRLEREIKEFWGDESFLKAKEKAIEINKGEEK